MQQSVLRVLVFYCLVCYTVGVHVPFDLKGWEFIPLTSTRAKESAEIATKHIGGKLETTITAFHWKEKVSYWDLYRVSFVASFSGVPYECHADVAWILNPNSLTVFNTGCVQTSALQQYEQNEINKVVNSPDNAASSYKMKEAPLVPEITPPTAELETTAPTTIPTTNSTTTTSIPETSSIATAEVVVTTETPAQETTPTNEPTSTPVSTPIIEYELNPPNAPEIPPLFRSLFL